MIVTWTALRARTPSRSVPWRPDGATWWQAGESGPGSAAPPEGDGRWWTVLATWPSPEAAAGPGPGDDVDAWHVVLHAACFRGDAVLAGGARPFSDLPAAGRTEGAAVVVTLAGVSPDGGREREFFRRFLHLARDVVRAPGHLASLAMAPADGAVLTFSAWEDAGQALDWAYAQPLHRAAADRGLVETSGFLRAAVLGSRGTLGDRPDPLAGRTGRVLREALP